MISDDRLLDFCRALAAAVRSGLPLSDAFGTLSKSPAHGRLIARAAELTAGGAALHEALKAQGIFPPVFIALIRAGEEGGKTDEFLDLFAGCLDVRIEFRRRIGRALIYPAFVVVLAGALFLAVSFKAVPILMEPLLGAGLTLPAPALWLSRLAGRVREHWPLVLAGIFIPALALRAFLLSGLGRKMRALSGHWLPVFRFTSEQARLYHIYTTMALLLRAGLPLSATMNVLLQFSQDDPVMHRRFLRAAALLAEGRSFSGSLEACIPAEDRAGLEIAEKAGRLEETLLRLGKAHCDRHLHRLKVLATGCTISATVALAPICFGLIFAIIRPVLSILGGADGLSPGTSTFSPAALPNRTPPPGGGRARISTGGIETEVDTKTALFNETRGGKIAEFIKKHSPKTGKASKKTAERAPERTQEQKETALIPKLGPVPQIKKGQSRVIEPTVIQPTK